MSYVIRKSCKGVAAMDPGSLGTWEFSGFCLSVFCGVFFVCFFLTDECSSNQLDQQGMYSLKEGNRAESLNRAVKGKNKEKTDE